MKDEYLTALGLRIKDLRTQKKMSMQELAMLAGYDSRASIYRIENGTQDIPHRKLQNIASALGVDIAVLLEGIDVIIETDPLQAKYLQLSDRNKARLLAYLDGLISSQEDQNESPTTSTNMG